MPLVVALQLQQQEVKDAEDKPDPSIPQLNLSVTSQLLSRCCIDLPTKYL